MCIVMEFVFECSTQYLMSEHSERVRYKVEHEKRYSNFISNHVLFCLLYKPTKNGFLTFNNLKFSQGVKNDITDYQYVTNIITGKLSAFRNAGNTSKTPQVM